MIKFGNLTHTLKTIAKNTVLYMVDLKCSRHNNKKWYLCEVKDVLTTLIVHLKLIQS